MKIKKTAIRISFLFICTLSFYNSAFAGFPIPKEYWMLSPMFSYYHASSYWNSSRNVVKYSNNGSFSSNYFGLYGGLGIDDDLNMIFNVPFIVQSYTNANYSIQNSSLGDASIGLSYFPHLNDPNKHLSLAGSLIIPLYQNTLALDTSITTGLTLPYTGFQKLGMEAKVGFSGTNVNYLKNTYYDVEVGFRTYMGGQGPTQTFFNATFGVPVNETFKIAGTLSGVNSGSNGVTSTTTTGANKDFGYTRVALAGGIKIGEQSSLWANVFEDVSGRNIGLGNGFSLFAVFKF